MKKIIFYIILITLSSVCQAEKKTNNNNYDLLKFNKTLSAAKKGDLEAGYNISKMYLNGLGVEKNIDKAFEWASKTGLKGHIKSRLLTADLFEVNGSPEDNLIVAKIYLKAANEGNLKAQIKVANFYQFGHVLNKDLKKSFDWFIKAAKQDSRFSEYNISQMYLNGLGVEKNHKKAFSWLEKSVQDGYVFSEFKMGLFYLQGIGVNKNDAIATEWLTKAANKNHIESQYYLGLLYLNKDILTSIAWFKKAANQNHIEAQHYLASIYRQGKGVVKKNNLLALNYFEKSAEQGHLKSQYITGYMYSYGEGVLKNYKNAYIWMSLAAMNNYSDSNKFRNILEKTLTINERQEAEALIKQIYNKIIIKEKEKEKNNLIQI
jgi:TPR repeat protein